AFPRGTRSVGTRGWLSHSGCAGRKLPCPFSDFASFGEYHGFLMTAFALRSRCPVITTAIWLLCLMAILLTPLATESCTLADDLPRNTVRLALAYYAVAASLLLLLGPEDWATGSARWGLARWTWTLAWAAYLVHLAMAFHYYHHWSHADAVEHTRSVSGVGEG